MCLTATQNGKFSLKSAWEICRPKSGGVGFASWLWDQLIPTKWSIFMWKALKKKIPLDDILKSRGIQLASQCKLLCNSVRRDN